MTFNQLLLYRLAELMLEKQENTLLVDDLFDDEQIGDFVKSIQIDSPYQQLLFEGVLTESVKDEQLYVGFTVEGYFHYVLGQVIYDLSKGNELSFFSQITNQSRLNGLLEGIEHCLILKAEKREFTVIANLIQTGDIFFKILATPIANAILIYSANFVINEIFDVLDDVSLSLLILVTKKLKKEEKNKVLSDLYAEVIKKVKPDSVIKAMFILESIEYIDNALRRKYLHTISQIDIPTDHKKTTDSFEFYYLLGNKLGFISEYDMAILAYEKAILLMETGHNQDKEILIQCYNSLGAAFCYKGDFIKGVMYYERALYSSITFYGDISLLTARSLNNLGSAMVDIGKCDAGIQSLENALDIRIKLIGKYHPDTAKTFNSLGIAYKEKGLYEKAHYNYQNALAIRTKIYGEIHPFVATVNSNLGIIYLEQTFYESAITEFLKSLNIRLETLGEYHNDTAVSYNNLAASYSKVGDFPRAINHFEKASEIWINLFGKNHHHIASCYNNIGTIYSNEKNQPKALLFFKKALKIRLKILGKEHPYTSLTFDNIGNAYYDLAEYLKAIPFFKKVLASNKKNKNQDQSQIGVIYYKIGMSYFLLQFYERAIFYFKKGMKANKSSGGFPFKIAECYERLNQTNKALVYYINAADIRKVQLGLNDSSTILAIRKCLILSELLLSEKLLPDWIKEFKNSV